MYQVLYRKWRPKTFSDVVGQSHITTTLSNELKEGRISHAYLFTGSRGTGKTTCAKIMAKAVNCENPKNGDPCNECEMCREINEEKIYDVIEIDAASNNSVDNIRDLREKSNFMPNKAKYRVYIIDEVHMLSTSAFNALLKTLEEPPAHVIFILATTEIHKIPATILSRCQRFDFRRISPEDIAEHLTYICSQENVEITPDAALLIAKAADGGMRDALSLLDKCITSDNSKITSEIVSNAAGITGKDHLFEVLDYVIKKDCASALGVINDIHNQSYDMEIFCASLLEHLRNLMISKSVVSAGNLIVCTPGDLEKYSLQSEGLSFEKLMFFMKMVEEAIVNIRKGVNRKTEAEICIVKMCSDELDISTQSLLSRIKALEKKLSQGIASVNENQTKPIKKEQNPIPSASEPLPPVDESPINSSPAPSSVQTNSGDDELFAQWGEVLKEIFIEDKPMISVLQNSSAFIRGEFILIKSDNPLFESIIRTAPHSTIIKKAIYNVTNKKYRLGIYKQQNTSEQKKDPLEGLINKL